VTHAIIFDLDNCLAAADEPGDQLLEPVFAAVRAANHGSLSNIALDAAFHDCWFHAFDWVAARHAFTPAMRDAGWSAFREIEVREPMRGYGDLEVLPELGERRFLVTSGFRRLQESKIHSLGIAACFDAVIVDAIDEPQRRGKERIFADLIADAWLEQGETLVVGDNAESELAAAKRLRLEHVQILRPSVVPAPDVIARVADLHELRRWIASRERQRDAL
jgi:putative hydrolase of the HAD superfamily